MRRQTVMAKPPRYLTGSIAVLWLWSGLQPLLTARDASLAYLARLGLPETVQWPLLLLASVWDVCLAVWIVWRPGRLMWWLQVATVLVYSVIVAVCLPENWLHPFAPLLKNVPIVALLVYLAQQANEQPPTVSGSLKSPG